MSFRKSDPKFIHAYERGMLRSAFKSLFWAIITERKKRPEGFTLMKLARDLSTSKHEVSRWFNGDPNWTINTIAKLASALDVDIEIRATDRSTGTIFTPAGVLTPAEVFTPAGVLARKQSVEAKSGGTGSAPLRVEQAVGLGMTTSTGWFVPRAIMDALGSGGTIGAISQMAALNGLVAVSHSEDSTSKTVVPMPVSLMAGMEQGSASRSYNTNIQ